jgi:hypothetical protein
MRRSLLSFGTPCAVLLALCVTAPAARGQEIAGPYSYGYLCDPGATWPNPSDSCCTAGAPFTCPTGGVSAATDRRNILLVISDDQDYCLYGFMAGQCSKDPGRSCTDELDCVGLCVNDAANPNQKTCSTDPTASCTADSQCTSYGSCVARRSS